MSDFECFSEATKNVRGVARIFPWGGPKYRFQNFGQCNFGQYPLPLPPLPGGVGTFPNYLNGYVPSNRVMILECFHSLRNSVCRVASQPVLYCWMSGQNLKIAGSDAMSGVGTIMCFFVDVLQLRHFMPTLVKRMHMFIQSTRKGGTWAPLATPLILALTLLAHKIQNSVKFCLRHQQRQIPKMG